MMSFKIEKRKKFAMMMIDKNDNDFGDEEDDYDAYWRMHDNVGAVIILIAIASLSS